MSMLMSSLLLLQNDRAQEEHEDVHQYDPKRERPYFVHASGVVMKGRGWSFFSCNFTSSVVARRTAHS
jgi:hypothetical protein